MKFLILATAVLSVVCWVASQTDKYQQVIEYDGQICKARTNASDSDIELIANHEPLETDTQKKLLHCIYQRERLFCGDFLRDIAFTIWAFCRVHDGNATKFENVTSKIQSAYDAGKALNDTNGPDAALAMYNCLRQQ